MTRNLVGSINKQLVSGCHTGHVPVSQGTTWVSKYASFQGSEFETDWKPPLSQLEQIQNP